MGAYGYGVSPPFIGENIDTPSYISALSDYDVIQMTGAYAPTNGNETMVSVTPSEWITSDPGTNAVDGVIIPWCGGAKGVGTKLYVHGGGHGNSANNGVYIYDFNGSTAPTGFESPLDISAVADVVTGGGEYKDGAGDTTGPSSVHTYDGMVNANDLGKLYRFGGSFFDTNGQFYRKSYSYDVATQTWSTLPDSPIDLGTVTSAYNPAAGKILVLEGNQYGAAFFDTSDNSWSSAKSVLIDNPYNGVTAYDSSRQRCISITSNQPGQQRTTLYTINWSTETVNSEPFSPTVDTAIFSESGLSMFYDAVRDSFWIFGGMKNSVGYSNIYEMDASTWVTTAHSLLPTGTTLPTYSGDYWGSYGRFVWLEDWRAIGFLTRHDAGPYVIKLPNS
jgi:hypothetical protein